MKKTYIIDTNVILHDFNCLHGFGDADIGIPITVLEEIDAFKKGRDELNYNAREFTRQIDQLSEGRNNTESLFNKGISIGKGKGKVFIIVDVQFTKEFGSHFFHKKEDHYILSAAYRYQEKHPQKEIIFVTKDINLRIKARSLGIIAKDYQTGKIKNVYQLLSNVKVIEDVDKNIIKTIYDNNLLNPIDLNIDPLTISPNQFFIIKNKNQSTLGIYDPQEKIIKNIQKKDCFGIMAKNSEQVFALEALTNPNLEIITITGKAGTGKTLLALAAALSQWKDFKQIILARPIVPLSNKDIGYLPGNAKNKIEPYMQPLYDNLSFIQNQYPEGSKEYNLIEELQKNGRLIISPLAYIRGRTLSNVCFIIDEAQNLSPHEVKTVVTRAGENTKIIFTGDINQIDTPFLDSESNGLAYVIDKFENQQLHAHVDLRKGERSLLSELGARLL